MYCKCCCCVKKKRKSPLNSSSYVPGYKINFDDKDKSNSSTDYSSFEKNIPPCLASSTKNVSKIEQNNPTGPLITTSGSGIKHGKLKTKTEYDSKNLDKICESSKSLIKIHNSKQHDNSVTYDLTLEVESSAGSCWEPKLIRIQKETVHVPLNSKQTQDNIKTKRLPNSKSKQNKDETVSKEPMLSLTAEEIRERCRIGIVGCNNTISYEGHMN